MRCLRLLPTLFQSRICRFAVIGSIGFAIEAAVLTVISTQSRFDVIYGRLLSFPMAVIVTWFLNRKLTFKSDTAPLAESIRYFSAQSFGALVNLGLFYMLVASFGFMAQFPILPLSFAAAAGLIVNYLTSRAWVFKYHE